MLDALTAVEHVLVTAETVGLSLHGQSVPSLVEGLRCD